MKFLKKTLSFILVLALLLNIFPTTIAVNAAGSTFSDINGHWAQAAIEELAAKGVINGMGDGTFQPEGQVTREQFMKLVIAVRGVSEGVETDVFYDVPNNAWSNLYIAEGLNRGIFSLNETNEHYFAPESPVDRDTVALWITRAVGINGTSDSTPFSDNTSISNKNAVAIAVAEGLIKGYEDNTYRPRNTLTRAESAVLIQRLIAKDAELNAPIEEHTEIILKDNVKKIEPPSGVNKLVSSDEEKGLYIFENIDDNIRNLQQDQIFTIYPCSSVPEGVAIKVKEIKITGNRAEIWNSGVDIGDIVSKLDSSGISSVTLDALEMEEDLPEGMTITNERGQSIAEAKAEKENGINLADTKSFTIGKATGFGIKFDKVEFSKNSPFSFSGSIWLETKLSHDIDYNFWRDGLDPKKIEVYYQLKKTIDVKVSCKAKTKYGDEKAFHDDRGRNGDIFGDTKSYDWARSISSNDSKSKKENFEKKIATISVPVGATGLCVYGAIFVGVSATGEIFIEIKNVETQKNGFRYQNGQTSSINEQKNETSASLGMEGLIKIGPKLEIGITFLHVIKAAVKGEGGLAIKGKTDVLKLEFNPDGSGGHNNIINNEKHDNDGNLSEVHDCWLCIDGDVYFYLEVGVVVGLTNIPFKGDISFINLKWPILDEKNAKFLDFYVSIRPLATYASSDSLQAQLGPVAFGLTECPHIYKAPNITKQPQNLTVEEAKEAEFSIDAENVSNKSIQMHSEQDGLSFDWYKDGVKVEGGINDKKLTIGLASKSDEGEYYCIVYLTENPDICKQSDKVTLTVTLPDPPEIEFTKSDKPVEVSQTDYTEGKNFSDVNTSGFSDKPVEKTISSENKGGDFGNVSTPDFSDKAIEKSNSSDNSGNNGDFAVIVPDF